VSFDRVQESTQAGQRIAIVLVRHSARVVRCTEDRAGLEKTISIAERAERSASEGSLLKKHLGVTVEQFRKAEEALQRSTTPSQSVSDSVQIPEKPVTTQEICTDVSTSGDRAIFTGKVVAQPEGARAAVFHVQHGSREVTCAVNRIGEDELPKALNAVRSASAGSELRINLLHTVAELEKAQATLAHQSTTTALPEPTQPTQQWTKGLVTGLSADGWPVMNNKTFPIYSLNRIPEGTARAGFLDWLVRQHGRTLECREHGTTGTYDCRVQYNDNDPRDHVDVADTLIKNGATTRM